MDRKLIKKIIEVMENENFNFISKGSDKNKIKLLEQKDNLSYGDFVFARSFGKFYNFTIFVYIILEPTGDLDIKAKAKLSHYSCLFEKIEQYNKFKKYFEETKIILENVNYQLNQIVIN